MREIIWLDSAVNDIARLREFIAKENPNAAKKAAEAIRDAAKHLMETPSIGKPVSDLPQYRELVTRFGAGGYVLRYRVQAETLYIVHVRHYREADFKL
jgi:plasmid stabilization system protein ParE